jgi:hypothetical protein
MSANDTGISPNEPTPPAATPRSDGVDYFSIDEAKGEFFRCLPYRATLSTTACAQRWREAQRASGNAAARYEKCRTCPIGAAHSGETVVYYSPLYGKPICSRCGRGSLRRMILGGTLCISCFNRQNEFLRGKNAKGNRPQIVLERRTVRYAIEGGGVDSLTLEHSVDLTELMVTVLRKVRGRISFAFHGGPMPETATA